MYTFDYHRPATLKDAAAFLKKIENARPISGGQSLTPSLKMRLSQPPALVERMQKEIFAVMAMPDVREQLHNAGLEPSLKDAEQFRGYIKSELAKWTKLIKDAGIKPD